MMAQRDPSRYREDERKKIEESKAHIDKVDKEFKHPYTSAVNDVFAGIATGNKRAIRFELFKANQDDAYKHFIVNKERADSHWKDTFSKENGEYVDHKTKLAADLLTQPTAKEGLQKLNDLFVKHDGSATFKYDQVHTSDGKVGHMTIQCFVSGGGYDGARFNLHAVINPKEGFKIEDIKGTTMGLKIIHPSHGAFQLKKFIESFEEEYASKKATSETPEQAIARKASINDAVNKLPGLPSSLKSVGAKFGVRSVNHETREISLRLDLPREARHPDEYGERGRKMEQEVDKWEGEWRDALDKVASKHNYSIDIHA